MTKFVIVLLATAAISVAKPVAEKPADIEFESGQLFHEDGSYTIYFKTVNMSRTETHFPSGKILGQYAYLDEDNFPVEVNFEAGEDGYRVHSANLPRKTNEVVEDSPEVIQARKEHFDAHLQNIKLHDQIVQYQKAYKLHHPEEKEEMENSHK